MRSALVPILLNSVPGWVRSNYGLLVPSVVTHYDEGRAWVPGLGQPDPLSLITVTRASNETTLLPSSASGASYLTFGSNVPARVPGIGLQGYQAATNLLLNSTAPATQTTASLGTGTYTLWVNGSGSATPSGATATITGAAAATNGSPNTFTVTVAGTVTVTVSGSLNAFQLESGTFGTPLIVTAGATATRAADMVVYPHNPLGAGNFTMFISVGGVAVQTGKFPTLLSINDGSGINEAQMYAANGGAGVNSKEQTSNVSRYDTTISSGISGGAGKVATTLNGTTARGAANGGNLTALGTWTASAAFTQMQLGADNGGANNLLNGYVKRVAIFQAGMTDAQMQALTT